jgi:hypothetical protein
MVWHLSGPSSVGKSTFILSSAAKEIMGVSHNEAKIIMAASAPKVLPDGDNVIYHLGILAVIRFSREGKKFFP